MKDSPRLALDTEFVGEDSFVPKLELIQVATERTAAVIDFPAVQSNGTLDTFWEIVCDPVVEKVVHAGRQDLDLFAVHAGQIPKPFFDTQIAAAMLGFALRSPMPISSSECMGQGWIRRIPLQIGVPARCLTSNWPMRWRM
ncbi:MAG: hypothetical protein HC801_08685 [Nitrospira sp.]|nr:hypothetical protein [Nitrospira sp.]